MIPHMCWHPMQIVWWIHVDNHLFNLQKQWNKWFCFLGGMAISFCMAWRSGQHSFKSTKTSKVTWKNDANKTLDPSSTNRENMGFNIPCIHIWPSVGAGGVIVWNQRNANRNKAIWLRPQWGNSNWWREHVFCNKRKKSGTNLAPSPVRDGTVLRWNAKWCQRKHVNFK